MNRDYSYNRRQLLSACSVLLLSPALRLVPGRTAELSGRGAWLSVFSALPILLIYALFISKFTESRTADEGAEELILRALGNRGGRIALCLSSLWFVVYCGFILRAGAERFITTVYTDAQPGIFIIVMVLLGLMAALGSERSIMRCARLMIPLIGGVLLLVLAAAIPGIKKANLLPLSSFDALYSFKGAVITVDVAVMPMYLSIFLGSEKSGKAESFSSLSLWLGIITLLLWLMELCIVGSFGAPLTAELTQPFFVLVRNLVLFRSLERIEALVVSLWVFTDFILVSLCLTAAQRLLRRCIGKRCNYAGEKLTDMSKGRWVIPLCAAAAAVFALLSAPDSHLMQLWSDRIIPYANLSFAFGVLPIIYIAGKAGKRL